MGLPLRLPTMVDNGRQRVVEVQEMEAHRRRRYTKMHQRPPLARTQVWPGRHQRGARHSAHQQPGPTLIGATPQQLGVRNSLRQPRQDVLLSCARPCSFERCQDEAPPFAPPTRRSSS
jgi:hypothetical protein